MASPRRTSEPGIPADSFADSPAVAIPLAGLLVDQPDLRDQLLPRSRWQELFDAYLNSPRP